MELRRLGEFQILRKLGEGGMGAVYQTYNEAEKATFAIKVLADNLALNQTYIDRFYREARSGVLLHHPNIVHCLTVGQDQSTLKHYMVMEYIDGPSLQLLLDKHGKLSVGDAMHIVLDVARALEHAHSRNIVHRDIKPGNILITPSGVAKLADLGLAKRTDEASSLTATRQTFGTPHYMPYEQAENSKNADNRSDIYALGATLYHMLTGEVPFTGDNHLEVVQKKNVGKFAAASKMVPGVPLALDRILSRMLARDPRKRYQTASELIIALERSELASAMLSFTDPVLALQDPWVQAQLAVDSRPTMPDMNRPAAELPKKIAEGDERWIVRCRDAAGKVRRYRATTEQIVRHMRAGRLPRNMEARPARRQTKFQPLGAYPEFQAVIAARPKVNKPTRPKHDGAAAGNTEPSSRRSDATRVALLVGVMTAFCALVWLVWHLLH
jgi:serine/threonine-protein kinase